MTTYAYHDPEIDRLRRSSAWPEFLYNLALMAVVTGVLLWGIL